MDATKKPLLIPPEFSIYAEKHGVFQIYEMLLKKLLIKQPDDPLQAIVDWLQEPHNVPNIIVLGPPGAGKRSISRQAADQLGCVYICKEQLSGTTNEQIVAEIKKKTESADCAEKGWLLEALPENRTQAVGLQVAGIFPKHVVLLDAEDTVLIERVMGKRIDSITGDVYHATFHPPDKPDVLKRLKSDPNATEAIMHTRLAQYHRTIEGILRCYQRMYKHVNADQPKDDVFTQCISYLSMKQRTNAPHTPRIILLGPVGSGKSVQAALLESKYNIVNINCEEVIKRTLESESELGESMKPYSERSVRIPDDLIVQALKNRLGQIDSVKRGWVLHGFPSTRTQVDALSHAGYEPNRVIVLDLPCDTSVERLSLRAVDPQTGERYHILYNPPKSNDVKTRLKTHPDDEESEIFRNYGDYQAHIEDILEFYEHLKQHINADQDIQAVFECIETMIVNPLPQIIYE